MFYGGGVDQLWRQAVGAGAVLAYSFVVSLVIGLVVKYTVGFRTGADAEVSGIDEIEHSESGYEFSGLRGGSVATALDTHSSNAQNKVPATASKEV